MSFGPGARAMVDQVIGFMAPGVTVTLRRNSNLRHQVNSTAISALTVASAVLAGVTTIDLEADSLAGKLIAGATFTIAGNATVYTTTANVEAEAGELAAVTFTPALAANAAEGAVVTIVQSYSDQVYRAHQAALDRESVSATIDGLARRLELAVDPGARAPEENDRIVAGLSRVERVAHVQAHEPELGYTVRWSIWTSTMAGVA